MESVIGVDIGQKRDPTAICVAEVDDRDVAQHYLIRYLERLPLGTPYPEVARRVGEIVEQVARKSESQPKLCVDATGVGTPVVDLLRESAARAWEVIGVYFTFGDRRVAEGAEVKLGKAFLVSRRQALLETGRLHLPQTRESAALSDELLNYEIRVDSNANDRYGAFRVGAHDDLVTALGLALQEDVQTGPICGDGLRERRSRLDCSAPPGCGINGGGRKGARGWKRPASNGAFVDENVVFP